MIKDQKLTKGLAGAILIDGNLDGSKLALSRRPTRWQRFWMRLLFGWKWANIKQLKTNK